MNLFEEIQSNDNIETLDLDFNENTEPPNIVIEKLIVKKHVNNNYQHLLSTFSLPLF